MSDNLQFHQGIHQEMVWKHPEMRTFAISLVEHAVELLGQAVSNFTTDVVPDSDRGDGQGVAGSVVELLKNASVIEPVGINADGTWYALRVASERPGSKSRFISVYKLTSRAIAEEFLRRNQRAVVPEQPELIAS